jgi:hypothetical protein
MTLAVSIVDTWDEVVDQLRPRPPALIQRKAQIDRSL